MSTNSDRPAKPFVDSPCCGQPHDPQQALLNGGGFAAGRGSEVWS
jgi:hypothetical protein